MVQNSKFTIQLLDKIGGPLASAIESVAIESEDKEIGAAKLMAQMLGQVVQVSISLNASFNLQEDGAQADSTRLALAALAAPLIADFYREKEHVPEDQDIKSIIKSLESVVAFAENFSPATDEASRLTTIDHDKPLFDKTQSSLVVIQAMVPVINAISEFSFGQSEIKLIQDVAQKLETKAVDITKARGLEGKLNELMVFKALAALYSQCHISETQKLASAGNEENRGELSLDPVWQSFETKVAMIDALLGDKKVTTEKASVPVSPVVEGTPTPVEPMTRDTQPMEQPAVELPSSPMGFFKKPKEAESASAETSVAQPAAEKSPLPEENKEKSEEESGGSSSSGGSGGPQNPMGFFKPPGK